ncbi:MAG: DUF349 domain-containing protein [Chitinophagales bacterium]
MEDMETALTKEGILEELSSLIQGEEFYQHSTRIKELRSAYESLTEQEEKRQRSAFDQKEDKEEEEEFVFSANPLDVRFVELKAKYSLLIKEHKAKLAEEEKKSLELKTALLADLKSLVEEDMQEMGAAFAKFYAIRDAWNAAGQVNKSKFKQVQYDYSHFRDLFYYNVGIHDGLKKYDLKKNAEEKQAVIEDLKALIEESSFKKMEKSLKELQAKWDEIGPTSQDSWEKLKDAYWDLVNGIYEKLRIHYKALRETKARILEEKQAVLAKMEALFVEVTDFKNPKQWVELNDKINALHQEWKQSGFISKDKEEAIWLRFKELSDKLREQKNSYFEKLKAQNSKVQEIKRKLIEEAEALQDSKEWKSTSEKLIKLQKRWKESGSAQRKVDQQLWEQFRAVCDKFFNTKNTYFATLDDRQEANFIKKEELCSAIAKSKSEEELKTLISEWQAVDYVPKKKINQSEANFEKAVDAVAKSLKIDKDKLENLRFEAKLSALKEDENADVKIQAERTYVQTQIDKIKEEIHRFEENMGFFGQSKGSQKLKEVVEKRLQEAETQLNSWKDKLKMLK